MTNTTPYALPDGYFYVDVAAAAQYDENAGTEIAMAQTVNVSVGDALDVWIQRVWIAGLDAQEVTPGTGRGLVGHTRRVPQYRVEEQIRSAGLPSPNDAEGAVTSILYKVNKPGEMPIVDHIALVRFLPVSATETEIVWTIKLTLSARGTDVFPDPATLAPFLHKLAPLSLAALAKHIDAAK